MPVLDGVLGDLRGRLVADHAVERRDDRRRRLGAARGRARRWRRCRRPSCRRAAARRWPAAGSTRARPAAITGICTLSSNEPLAPAHATVASLPTTRAATMSTASGMTGLTLPGMIDEPGCRSGIAISPRPGVRAGAHPAQVVADLGEADRDGAQRTGQLDQPVARALRLEVVARLGQRQARCPRASSAMTRCGKPAGVLIPVPTAVPPSGTSAARGSADCEPLDAVAHRRGVAAELLAERHRAWRP